MVYIIYDNIHLLAMDEKLISATAGFAPLTVRNEDLIRDIYPSRKPSVPSEKFRNDIL